MGRRRGPRPVDGPIVVERWEQTSRSMVRRSAAARMGTALASGSPPVDVYDWCMARTRTNIAIENSYVERIMERYNLRTKTDAVDFALRKAACLPMTLKEVRAMEGAHAIDELPGESPIVDL